MTTVIARQREWAELRAKAIAIILKHPGLDQDSLAVKLGFSPMQNQGTRRSIRNKKVARLLNELIAAGLVRTEKEQFARQGDPRKIYPTQQLMETTTEGQSQ